MKEYINLKDRQVNIIIFYFHLAQTGWIFEKSTEFGFLYPHKRSKDVKKTFHKNVPRPFSLNIFITFREH